MLLNIAAKLQQKRGVLSVQELFTGRHFSHKFIALVDADDLVDLDQMLAGVIAQVSIFRVFLKPTQSFLALSANAFRLGLEVTHKLNVFL